jgi:hypothetical protein
MEDIIAAINANLIRKLNDERAYATGLNMIDFAIFSNAFEVGCVLTAQLQAAGERALPLLRRGLVYYEHGEGGGVPTLAVLNCLRTSAGSDWLLRELPNFWDRVIEELQRVENEDGLGDIGPQLAATAARAPLTAPQRQALQRAWDKARREQRGLAERLLMGLLAATQPAADAPVYLLPKHASITTLNRNPYLEALWSIQHLACEPERFQGLIAANVHPIRTPGDVFEDLDNANLYHNLKLSPLAVRLLLCQCMDTAFDPRAIAAYTGRPVPTTVSIKALTFMVNALLGPVNGMPDGSRGPCGTFGCAMFACHCHEGTALTGVEDEEGSDEIGTHAPFLRDDWFTGACDSCARRLSSPVHAWRLPVEEGGWYGCYCSRSCTTNGHAQREELLLRDGDVEEDTGLEERLDQVEVALSLGIITRE